ncbi:MAG: hydrogenase/urease maturation nickel metallochaperone HypA [Candidatus Dormibacteria bacterium]
MHEMGLAQAILDTALQIAGDRPVSRVTVSAGEQQAVSPESLSFSFELIAAGTAATGATLQVRAVPGVRLLVDEVEVAGDNPEVLRRSDAEVVEAAHQHSQDGGDRAVHPAWL